MIKENKIDLDILFNNFNSISIKHNNIKDNIQNCAYLDSNDESGELTLKKVLALERDFSIM